MQISNNYNNPNIITDQKSLNKKTNHFMKMLMTQIKNQDPLSPMDSEKMTNQLVQFSQIEQQLQQNSKLDQIMRSNLQQNHTSALNYIDKFITIEDNVVLHKNNKHNFNYRTNYGNQKVAIYIKNQKGEVVRHIQVPQQQYSGWHKASWDGKDDNNNIMQPGHYTIIAAANDKNDTSEPLSVALKKKVTGITLINNTVNLITGHNATPINKVLAVENNKN